MQATHTLSNAAHTNIHNALAFAPTASLKAFTPIPQSHQAYQARPVKHVGLQRIDLQGDEALDFACAIAASVWQASIPASYAGIQVEQRDGMKDLCEAKIGPLVACDEGSAPSPSVAEEAIDLFLEGCVEMSDLATYIPPAGRFVKVRTLIRKVIRIGLFA